jgi:hypothetical protein
MTDDQLTARQVAAMAGIEPGTLRKYVTLGLAPAPDGQLGTQNWWHRSTVEHWLRNRPGRGARTDLKGKPSMAQAAGEGADERGKADAR